ncbi:hypothetical protein SAMN00017405_0292 [Desulfonispora thiosulfatigenes DSM 11270]|uniref:Divergent PAP2 family protein n=1 Tax=Desulfonispora thiosulfatigenes DSM 11270 TaxID=656914 RepID=A0A1W1VNJ3_DESTI|nr:divergent PAP2 family protein [Desulfonispora thiosulfatigenes]SMB94898.1 hypothetical protein SAMN00017405_0292 [Desulfonispora thiosulfatigenes DSM 11270]
MSILEGIFSNNVLKVILIAWALAQVLKVIIILFTKKRLNLNLLISSGGMPSSHSAFSTSLAVSVGKLMGFESPEFAICFAFAMVVMYDAAGVRRAAGKQAKILNSIIEDFYYDSHFNKDRLKELLGHTPIEVFAGALLGILVAYLF